MQQLTKKYTNIQKTVKAAKCCEKMQKTMEGCKKDVEGCTRLQKAVTSIRVQKVSIGF